MRDWLFLISNQFGLLVAGPVLSRTPNCYQIGHAITALSLIAESYPLFILARFVTGLLEGSGAVARAMLADSALQDDGSVQLIENHCPICAAARECQNFCRSELEIFQRVMGQGCKVERSEHLLAGARRCVYVIRPV